MSTAAAKGLIANASQSAGDAFAGWLRALGSDGSSHLAGLARFPAK